MLRIQITDEGISSTKGNPQSANRRYQRRHGKPQEELTVELLKLGKISKEGKAKFGRSTGSIGIAGNHHKRPRQ